MSKASCVARQAKRQAPPCCTPPARTHQRRLALEVCEEVAQAAAHAPLAVRVLGRAVHLARRLGRALGSVGGLARHIVLRVDLGWGVMWGVGTGDGSAGRAPGGAQRWEGCAPPPSCAFQSGVKRAGQGLLQRASTTPKGPNRCPHPPTLRAVFSTSLAASLAARSAACMPPCRRSCRRCSRAHSSNLACAWLAERLRDPCQAGSCPEPAAAAATARRRCRPPTAAGRTAAGRQGLAAAAPGAAAQAAALILGAPTLLVGELSHAQGAARGRESRWCGCANAR